MKGKPDPNAASIVHWVDPFHRDLSPIGWNLANKNSHNNHLPLTEHVNGIAEVSGSNPLSSINHIHQLASSKAVYQGFQKVPQNALA